MHSANTFVDETITATVKNALARLFMLLSLSVTASVALHTKKSFVYPFKTYAHMKSDPYNAITNAFSKLKKDEGAVVQFVVRPVESGWQKKLQKEAQHVINPKKSVGSFVWWNPLTWLIAVIDLFTSSDKDLGSEMAKSSERNQ